MFPLKRIKFIQQRRNIQKRPSVNAEILVDYIISGLTHISIACFTWIWIIESGNCRCVKPTNPGPRCKMVPPPYCQPPPIILNLGDHHKTGLNWLTQNPVLGGEMHVFTWVGLIENDNYNCRQSKSFPPY